MIASNITRRGGGDYITCPYYKEMDAVLGKKTPIKHLLLFYRGACNYKPVTLVATDLVILLL